MQLCDIDDIKIINNFILNTILRCSLTPKYLLPGECQKIIELNSEKKRNNRK